METITVQCESVNITPNDGDMVNVELKNLNLVGMLNDISLETALNALIDSHDFGSVFDAVIAMHNEAQDEN